jgi:hypothetical protein
MPTRAPLLRIHEMLESIQGIENAIKGKPFRDYQRSWVLRSVVEISFGFSEISLTPPPNQVFHP